MPQWLSSNVYADGQRCTACIRAEGLRQCCAAAQQQEKTTKTDLPNVLASPLDASAVTSGLVSVPRLPNHASYTAYTSLATCTSPIPGFVHPALGSSWLLSIVECLRAHSFSLSSSRMLERPSQASPCAEFKPHLPAQQTPPACNARLQSVISPALKHLLLRTCTALLTPCILLAASRHCFPAHILHERLSDPALRCLCQPYRIPLAVITSWTTTVSRARTLCQTKLVISLLKAHSLVQAELTKSLV